MSANKTFFIARSIISDPRLQADFDRWYSTDHMPLAMSIGGFRAGHRLWSQPVQPGDPLIHYAVYEQIADAAPAPSLDAEGPRRLLREYDERWPVGVTRTREILELVETLKR
jgi:hypothetical protein